MTIQTDRTRFNGVRQQRLQPDDKQWSNIAKNLRLTREEARNLFWQVREVCEERGVASNSLSDKELKKLVRNLQKRSSFSAN